MKNSIVLMITGAIFIIASLFAAERCNANFFIALFLISGFVIFIVGTMKMLKQIQDEKE